LKIAVRLTPKAGSDRIDGLAELADSRPVLAARVSSAPEDGKANTALEKLIAKALGVPRSSVSVTSGHKARLKQVRIAGNPATLLDRAERLWPTSAEDRETEA
jgi:uncharacterized protein (TIGR00251 family)